MVPSLGFSQAVFTEVFGLLKFSKLTATGDYYFIKNSKINGGDWTFTIMSIEKRCYAFIGHFPNCKRLAETKTLRKKS